MCITLSDKETCALKCIRSTTYTVSTHKYILLLQYVPIVARDTALNTLLTDIFYGLVFVVFTVCIQSTNSTRSSRAWWVWLLLYAMQPMNPPPPLPCVLSSARILPPRRYLCYIAELVHGGALARHHIC